MSHANDVRRSVTTTHYMSACNGSLHGLLPALTKYGHICGHAVAPHIRVTGSAGVQAICAKVSSALQGGSVDGETETIIADVDPTQWIFLTDNYSFFFKTKFPLHR